MAKMTKAKGEPSWVFSKSCLVQLKDSETSVKKICCIGADHIGGLFCSVIALKCPEIEVTVVDENEGKIMQWNCSKLPIYESFLCEIVNKCRRKNLFFTVNAEQAIKEADIIFICSDSELKAQEEGCGKAVNLKPLEDAARLIANAATSSKIVVEKSSVPVRAAQTVSAILKANEQPDRNFVVLSNPEFLTEASAVNDLLYPERVLIGGDKTPQATAAIETLISVYEHWVPRKNIITADTWSSQLAKLATNAFLAQRMSSINSLTEVCEVIKADVSEVATAIGMDSRIGPKGLEPSIGFEGSCFYKDILNMIYLCEYLNLPQVASYWQSVLDLNEYQKKRFTKRIIKAFLNALTNKQLAILGFSSKKNIGGTLDSPATFVCKTLLEKGAKLNIYDPILSKVQITEELKKVCNTGEEKKLIDLITVFDDSYEAVEATQGIIVCTDWPEFSSLDYFKVFNEMTKPAYIFDGTKILPHNELIDIGFYVFTIGKNFNSDFTPT